MEALRGKKGLASMFRVDLAITADVSVSVDASVQRSPSLAVGLSACETPSAGEEPTDCAAAALGSVDREEGASESTGLPFATAPGEVLGPLFWPSLGDLSSAFDFAGAPSRLGTFSGSEGRRVAV